MSERLGLIVSGRPVPLQRSRTRQGRHYLPAASRQYRQVIEAEWMAAGRPSLGDRRFSLSARFYGANQQADIDNLVKAVLDALGGLAFTNDHNCVCIAGAHKLPADAGGARAEIDIWATA